MKTIEINEKQLSATAETISVNKAVFMLNLLRYKKQADYQGHADAVPCSGREAYFERYAPTFNEVAAALGVEGIEIFYVGVAAGHLIAPPDERWDDIAIIKYPNFAAFRRVVESPEYHTKAEFHRTAALEDSRLIATTKMELPG